ncbi:MAG: L,D-transpeptidase family protein [Actinomycetota bacterium]|nr:L,D-transpeptidase family protein [Actinomycetota bacterium]
MAEHSRRRLTGRHLLVSGATLVIVAAGAFVAVNRASGKVGGPPAADASATTLPSPEATSSPGASSTTTPAPLTVTSVLPVDHASAVAYSSTITVSFSAPLAASSPPPSLSPPLAGSWTRSPDSFTFTPSSPMVPSTLVHVSAAAGPGGILAASGEPLAAPFSSSFTVAVGSTLRLQQLLAQLDYLPVQFSQPLTAEATTAAAVSLVPEQGTFTWRFPNTPSQLEALWTPGAANVITQAAVMRFETDHGLAADGDAGPLVWGALLKAVADRETASQPYDYLIATETLPETLYVWREGRIIYQSPANTGVAGAATPLGTWPVYLRYTATTMTGTNPDGSHYNDPGVPWVSYFYEGDAVHGFVRAHYGFPQSDGCVELPVANAATVFPLDPLGTLVTVTSGNLTTELAPAGATPPVYG